MARLFERPLVCNSYPFVKHQCPASYPKDLVVNVFVLMTQNNGETEQVDLGSLYVERDGHGFLRRIAIEPYSDLYQAHFECFNTEIPEVPLEVRIAPDSAFIIGFFEDEGYWVELDELQDETDENGRSRLVDNYDKIVRIVYRLYERVVRGEPVFVGYADIEQHRDLLPHTILGLTPPLAPLPPRQRLEVLQVRGHAASAAKRERTLRRVSLHAEPQASAGFPNKLELNVCTRADAFPDRAVRILGVTDTGRPLVVAEDGGLRISDTKGFYTNLMACEMVPEKSVFVWTAHCQQSQSYQIKDVEVLTVATEHPSEKA